MLLENGLACSRWLFSVLQLTCTTWFKCRSFLELKFRGRLETNNKFEVLRIFSWISAKRNIERPIWFWIFSPLVTENTTIFTPNLIERKVVWGISYPNASLLTLNPSTANNLWCKIVSLPKLSCSAKDYLRNFQI